jgi:hypothetical protein
MPWILLPCPQGAYFLKPRVITGRDLHLDYM